MSAEITRTSVPRRLRAWCEECQDGYQGGKPTVAKWADRHNRERHPNDPMFTNGKQLSVDKLWKTP